MANDWFLRDTKGVLTDTTDKRETPDGLWYKCPSCKEPLLIEDLNKNGKVCYKCSYHIRIGAKDYFHLLFDKQTYKELFKDLKAVDILDFKDTKPYSLRLVNSRAKTGLSDAILSATGKMNSHRVNICAMDFSFIGGSMGIVVGEKISKTIDDCIKNKLPLIIISKSGGARMMEAAYSLMQMAKISAKLTLLAKNKLPYISVLTDPTTGGVTASFAMLGDINIAEPGALIGFAGPRVIQETIKQELPEGFQSAEFVKECGFLDFIVDRREMKDKIATFLSLVK